MAHGLFDLTGKTALVTGGSTGLGYAMAEALVGAGARVLIIGRRAEPLEQAAARLRALPGGGEVLTDSVDLYDRGSVDAFIARTLGSLGAVDIFVGNAGAVHAELVGNITYAEIDHALQLNLTANIMLTQAFVPGMQQRGWGRVIYSSSTASHLAFPLQGNIVYAATKSGLNAFARSLAGDLGRSGITVNSIILGVYWTDIVYGAERQVTEMYGAEAAATLIHRLTEITAVGRLGQPEDLHGVVLLLASDAGRYITGASIPVDGGASIMMAPYPA